MLTKNYKLPDNRNGPIKFKEDNIYRLKLTIFCLLFAMNAALPCACLAETYYVDAVNGFDSNPGTSDDPWQTGG